MGNRVRKPRGGIFFDSHCILYMLVCVVAFVAKFGTPNQRIETLFSYVPEIRSLGMLHYKMTKTLSLQAEEVMKAR